MRGKWPNLLGWISLFLTVIGCAAVLYARLSVVENEVTEAQTQLASVENKLDSVKEWSVSSNAKLSALNARLDRHEARSDRRLDKLESNGGVP